VELRGVSRRTLFYNNYEIDGIPTIPLSFYYNERRENPGEMELAGIEPASREAAAKAATSVVSIFYFA